MKAYRHNFDLLIKHVLTIEEFKSTLCFNNKNLLIYPITT